MLNIISLIVFGIEPDMIILAVLPMDLTGNIQYVVVGCVLVFHILSFTFLSYVLPFVSENRPYNTALMACSNEQ